MEVIGSIYTGVTADFQRGVYPIARCVKAENHDLGVIMADVNVIGSLEAKFESASRIYDAEGYSPTFNAIQSTSNCLASVQKDNLLLENNIQKVGQISSNGSQCGTVISDNGISANLAAGTHGYANSHIATQYRIRKLTPRECGRLMGVSDEDIDKMAAVNSNTQLYKQFGNSIVVDVMCAMFKNLNINQ